jgi:hypothetical protein
MNTFTLRSTFIAAAISLAMLAPAAQAQAPRPSSAGASVGLTIAAQGNAALRLIRAELKAAVTAAKPTLPPRARATKVSAPATGSLPATAVAAE